MPIKQNVTYKLTSSLKFCNRLSQLNGLISLAEMLVHQITNHARLSANKLLNSKPSPQQKANLLGFGTLHVLIPSHLFTLYKFP